MTEDTIREGNKLINDILASGIDPIPTGIPEIGIISGDYHSDLDILCIVADKLKKFFTPRDKDRTYTGCCEISINLNFEGRRHDCESRIYGELNNVRTPHIVNRHVNPCMALWLSIVEFIKWYNTQTPNNP